MPQLESLRVEGDSVGEHIGDHNLVDGVPFGRVEQFNRGAYTLRRSVVRERIERHRHSQTILNLKSSVRLADDSVLALSVCRTVLVDRSTRSTRAMELSESPEGVVVTDMMAASITMVEPTAP